MTQPSPYRKCPSCRRIIGQGLDICPLCGDEVRGAALRRLGRYGIFLLVAAGIAVWYLGHRGTRPQAGHLPPSPAQGTSLF